MSKLLDDDVIYSELFKHCRQRGRKVAISSFVTNNTNLKLSKEELAFLCLIVEKRLDKEKRKPLSDDEKVLLYKKTPFCCCCHVPLSFSDAVIDHILPYSWVGDGLCDNYQILCSRCNNEKRDNPMFPLIYFANRGLFADFIKELSKYLG